MVWNSQQTSRPELGGQQFLAWRVVKTVVVRYRRGTSGSLALVQRHVHFPPSKSMMVGVLLFIFKALAVAWITQICCSHCI